MAYPQRGVPPHRQYNDRPPPPQNYGYHSRGRGGYGPGPRNPNYDNRRQYHDERGGYGGGGGRGGRGFHDPYAPPNRGRGGPPPDRHGYGERRPMNGPPPGPPPGQLPPNFDKSFPRPPPLQNRPRHRKLKRNDNCSGRFLNTDKFTQPTMRNHCPLHMREEPHLIILFLHFQGGG